MKTINIIEDMESLRSLINIVATFIHDQRIPQEIRDNYLETLKKTGLVLDK